MNSIVERVENSLASVTQLAAISGVPASTINNWIGEKSNPKEKHVKLVDAALTKITGFTIEQIKDYVEKLKAKSDADEQGQSEEMPADLDIKPSKPKEVILTGKHTPLRLTSEQYAEAFGDWKGLPMFNTPVTASFIQTYRDEKTYTPQYYLHDPRFRDCDFGAIITGDSMYSEIRHGDFIACKEVVDRRFIVFGDIYYVVATNGLETCKYVNRDPEDKNNLLLVPRNEKIDPSPIPKDMILKMYKVRGIIRGY